MVSGVTVVEQFDKWQSTENVETELPWAQRFDPWSTKTKAKRYLFQSVCGCTVIAVRGREWHPCSVNSHLCTYGGGVQLQNQMLPCGRLRNTALGGVRL